MKLSEFHQWLDHHKSIFSGVGTYLDSRDDHLQFWRQYILPLDYLEACAASELLYDDDAVHFSEHPKQIKRIIQQRKNSERERQEAEILESLACRSPRWNCHLCEDKGWVLCTHNIRKTIRGREMVVRSDYGCWCTCRYATEIRQEREKAGGRRLPRQYDPEWDVTTSDYVDALALPDNWRVWRPDGSILKCPTATEQDT